MTDRRAALLNTIATIPDFSQKTVWQHLLHSLEKFDRDIPLAVLYSVDDDIRSKRCTLHLEGSLGIPSTHPAVPAQTELHASADGFGRSFRESKEKDDVVVFETLPSFLADGVEWRGFGDPSNKLVTLSFPTGIQVVGFLVIGLNPRRPYDKDAQQFVQDLRQAVSAAIKSSTDFDQARERENQVVQDLAATERFVRTLAEVAPVGMYNVNADGFISWANAKCKIWASTSLMNELNLMAGSFRDHWSFTKRRR